MTREEFLRMSAVLGLGAICAPSLLTSCKKDELNVTFNGKVLIIGAGAAGLIAAYTLHRYGIDFELIEASSTFGGRVKKDTTLADFPIDLGAEWLHDQPSMMGQIANDPNISGSIDLIPYNPQSVVHWNGSQLTNYNVGGLVYGEYKFKKTWFDYFAEFIVPPISSKMVFNNPVSSIDYSGNQVIVTSGSNTYQGDKVIVTVPITILQNNSIQFTPALSSAKQEAINSVEMPDGIKVFIEFSEKFYPDVLIPGEILSVGSYTYFDAGFKKGGSKHVLGLFVVGENATQYSSLPSDQATVDYILAELDGMYNGKATQTYLNHSVQNWSNEPYIRGSYSYSGSNDDQALRASVNGKVYFAGEAYSDIASATVHGAGISGRTQAESILTGG